MSVHDCGGYTEPPGELQELFDLVLSTYDDCCIDPDDALNYRALSVDAENFESDYDSTLREQGDYIFEATRELLKRIIIPSVIVIRIDGTILLFPEITIPL